MESAWKQRAEAAGPTLVDRKRSPPRAQAPERETLWVRSKSEYTHTVYALDVMLRSRVSAPDSVGKGTGSETRRWSVGSRCTRCGTTACLRYSPLRIAWKESEPPPEVPGTQFGVPAATEHDGIVPRTEAGSLLASLQRDRSIVHMRAWGSHGRGVANEPRIGTSILVTARGIGYGRC